MTTGNLVLVLGDQLTHDRGALAGARPGTDHVVMAEVRREATYVTHNRHKIALIFAAMRRFRDELRCCEPGEYRLLSEIERWKPGVPVAIIADDRFLTSRADFSNWAQGRKQLRMEHFYRQMRRRYGILLDDDGKPEGGKWNYDAHNRKGWRGQTKVPRKSAPERDPVTAEVLELVTRAFPDNPGDLGLFYLATDRAGAGAQLEWFVDCALPCFGAYQDALAEESPFLFHATLSMYLNIGLLDPLETCRRIERAWREGRCELAAAEGFIRQILGWREYVHGVYWLAMPDYATRNSLDARAPLPAWFWNGETDLRCLQQALRQTLDLGYAHHIQRLMVIGNFCLLNGIDVEAVCEWYLAVYADAFEWVELPNTLGMALYGDNGLMASKPYAASGKYIQRQGDHCGHCRYDPKKLTGEGACPYNSLYWDFIDRHRKQFENNPRMSLTLRNWQRKPSSERGAIIRWAERERERLVGA